MTAPALVQKLWNYCNILRDDGLSYGDYLEQLTFADGKGELLSSISSFHWL
jgi:type I restriction-modification system DNA methylase subunit